MISMDAYKDSGGWHQAVVTTIKKLATDRSTWDTVQENVHQLLAILKDDGDQEWMYSVSYRILPALHARYAGKAGI